MRNAFHLRAPFVEGISPKWKEKQTDSGVCTGGELILESARGVMSVEEKTQTDEQRRKAAESLREHDRTAAQAQEVKSPYQSGAELDGTYTIQEARDRRRILRLQERGNKREGNGAHLKEYDAWRSSKADTWAVTQ